MEKLKASNIKEKLIDFLSENFILSSSDLSNETSSFMDNGILDSTGILELIMFIEETFLIEVEDEEMIPENLDSIENVVIYIAKKI